MLKKRVAWELELVSVIIKGAQTGSRMHLVAGLLPDCVAVGASLYHAALPSS